MKYRDRPSERAYKATTWIAAADMALDFASKWAWPVIFMAVLAALVTCIATVEPYDTVKSRCKVSCHPHPYEMIWRDGCFCLPDDKPAVRKEIDND